MHIITETFEDYSDPPRTVEKKFYFNLEEWEAIRLQFDIRYSRDGKEGGYAQYLQELAETENPSILLPEFEKLIEMTYGQKTEDGLRFVKAKDDPFILEEFRQTRAYSQILTRLATDGGFAGSFVSEVFPKNMATMDRNDPRVKQVLQGYKKKENRPMASDRYREPVAEIAEVDDEGNVVELPRTLEDYTPLELMRMTEDERNRLMAEFESRSATQD